MRSYYVRRKDLDHVPFQYYVSSDGVARTLDEGYTAVFAIIPPKEDIDVFYVRVVNELVHEMTTTLELSQGDILRVAAKGVEAWLKGEPIPSDHFYGPEWLKLDRDWYPRNSDGTPALAANPYSFEVISDEPWPSILDWDFTRERKETPVTTQPARDKPLLVFGFTLDHFPGTIILGFEQLKHKIDGAGIQIDVKMLPLDNLPSGVHTLFVPPELEESAQRAAPRARILVLTEMVNAPLYDTLVQEFEQDQISEPALGHA